MATDPAAIGTKIAKRRHQLGLTQEQLADELSVSKSTVANWERGKHLPIRHAGAIELRLGISLDDDTDGDGHRTATREEMRAAVDRLRAEADRVAAMLDEGEANGHTGRAS